MSVHEMMRQQIDQAVPFARHIGVALTDLGPGTGTARLDQTPSSSNHIGSQHAGAIFTLGEAASGAAAAGVFGPDIMSLRPVAAKAEIAYLKIAKGTLTATARASRPVGDITADLADSGKVAFDVYVSISDAEEDEVATMTVAWHVRRK